VRKLAIDTLVRIRYIKQDIVKIMPTTVLSLLLPLMRTINKCLLLTVAAIEIKIRSPHVICRL